jgi:hypothetical protein
MSQWSWRGDAGWLRHGGLGGGGQHGEAGHDDDSGSVVGSGVGRNFGLVAVPVVGSTVATSGRWTASGHGEARWQTMDDERW